MKQKSPGRMKKFALIAILVAVVLGIIVVLQNTESVETKLLIVTVTMPRAVLLFVTAMIGFAAGVILSLGMMRKAKGDKQADKTA